MGGRSPIVRPLPMDKVIETILTQGGLLGAILIATVLYFLRAEKMFWAERKDFNDRLQQTYEGYHKNLTERYQEQQKIVEELFQSISELKIDVLNAEKEFASLKEMIEQKLEQMLLVSVQRSARAAGQTKSMSTKDRPN